MRSVYGDRHWVGILLVCAFLTGCASDVYRVPTRFSPSAERSADLLTIVETVEVASSSGYARLIQAGSTWRFLGRIPEGRVYAIKNDVFMLEGKHMHEAHCVINDDALLVGFFLPVEQAFSPLTPPVRLSVKTK
jgi:hypothetical protein